MADKYEFSRGETVRIKTGLFQSFKGRITKVDDVHGKLTVVVEIIGKPRPVELNFLDVEKVSGGDRRDRSADNN